eukprot:scaffold210934_cov47-Prasinocladus_malaysianus.AAC.1
MSPLPLYSRDDGRCLSRLHGVRSDICSSAALFLLLALARSTFSYNYGSVAPRTHALKHKIQTR